MHRIDSATAEADKFGSGKDGFTEGDPAAGIPATATTDDWFNSVQEEFASVIESVGATLAKGDNRQLWRTMRVMLSRLAVGAAQQVAGGITGTYRALALANFAIDGSNAFACGAGDGGVISTSVDTYTWTNRSPAGAYSGTFRGIAYGTSTWVIVGDSGEIETSSGTGATWTKRTQAASYSGAFRSIVWAESLSLFIAVGDTGEIQSSPDGITWTHRTADASYSGTFRGVAFGNGVAVAVGDTGEIQTSVDGITWSRVTTSGTENLASVGFGENTFIATSPGSSVNYVSTDDGVSFDARSQDSVLGVSVAYSEAFGWIFGMAAVAPCFVADPVNDDPHVAIKSGFRRLDINAEHVVADNHTCLFTDASGNFTILRAAL